MFDLATLERLNAEQEAREKILADKYRHQLEKAVEEEEAD